MVNTNNPRLSTVGKVLDKLGALTKDGWHVRFLHPLGLLLFPIVAIICGTVGFVNAVKESMHDHFRVW